MIRDDNEVASENNDEASFHKIRRRAGHAIAALCPADVINADMPTKKLEW